MSTISALTNTQASNLYKISAGALERAQKNETQSTFSDPLEALVDAGTISEDQEDSIRIALEAAMQNYSVPLSQETMEEGLSDALDTLVDAGVITDSQKDSVTSTFESIARDHPPMPPGGGMSVELSDALHSLAEDGTLTQDQLDAITSAWAEAMQDAKPPGGPVPDGVQNALDSLTEAGTLSEEEEDAIISAVETLPFSKADGETIDPLEELLESGTITQDQTDAVKDALQTAAKARKALEAYGMSDVFTESLDAWVQSGAITAEEEGSISQLLGSLPEREQSQVDLSL